MKIEELENYLRILDNNKEKDVPDWLSLVERGMKKVVKQVNKIKLSIYHLL